MTTTTGAVFLDRDGTLIEDRGYLGEIGQVAFYPWSVDVVRVLNRAGVRVVLVTNQAGVARGYFKEEAVHAVHRHIDAVLSAGGARIDAYYYCPHHPAGTVTAYAERCTCRKPGPGLVERAARELGIDPRRSFVVGDKWVDVGLARAVGARAVLVRTGYGRGEEANPQPGLAADLVADNLAEAAGWILERLA